MKKTIFEFSQYTTYLNHYLSSLENKGYGQKRKLALAIDSTTSHVSQVLNDNTHFTLEQADRANTFLGHTEDEADFFLLLVQHARAGTKTLRDRFKRQMADIVERRQNLKQRLGVKSHLTVEDQATFYSSWHYGAIHVMLTIPEFQTKENLARYLQISLKRVSEIIEFLVSVGLAQLQENGKIKVGVARIHLGKDSPLISKSHINWRIKAMESLSKSEDKQNLHYTSVVTCSSEDVTKIKEKLVSYIEEIKSIIRDSPAEEVHSFDLDFFKVLA